MDGEETALDLQLLENALATIKDEYETAIHTRTANLGGNFRSYSNGLDAKSALIKSQRLILGIHEVVKKSLEQILAQSYSKYSIFPPIGQSKPELTICGAIKAKAQDVVILFDDDLPTPEKIDSEGPLLGTTDPVGKAQSERSLVIGVRSQLSSVSKNFDTLMERAFAETLNLRLRLPKLVMGEVYVLPIKEYDDQAMKQDRVSLKNAQVDVDKFIKTFLAISGRDAQDYNSDIHKYKYERSALVIVDFGKYPPKVFATLEELQKNGYRSSISENDFRKVSPDGFAKDIIAIHRKRHS